MQEKKFNKVIKNFKNVIMIFNQQDSMDWQRVSTNCRLDISQILDRKNFEIENSKHIGALIYVPRYVFNYNK